MTAKVASALTNSVKSKSRKYFSNLEKIYWPKTSEHAELTKKDLIDYYDKISDYILPYLLDGPLSLSRYPHGITGKHFFHKNWEAKDKPEFLDTVQVYSKSSNRIINHLVCNNKDALLWIVNLGCIEMHPWYSRIKDYAVCNAVAAANSSFSSPSDVLDRKEKKCGLNYPDFIIFDLDPYIYADKQDDEEVEEENEPKYQINSFKATVEVAYNLKAKK